LNDISNQISFSGHHLLFDDSVLKEYKFSEETYSNDMFLIDKEPFEQVYLPAYAAAFQLLYSDASVLEVSDEIFVNEKTEFKYKLIFKKLSLSLLGIVLLVLIINVFLFHNYFEENQQLAIEESHFNGQISKVDSLEKAIKEKEKFLSEGWSNRSRISYHLDKIAASLPYSMRLNVLSVSPFDEKMYKSEKKIEFSLNVVNIVGLCQKSTDLNPWMKDLKSMEFVKDVKIQNYSFDNKAKEGKFNLEIYIK
jgi:Tfp pilus assembly protein PilN